MSDEELNVAEDVGGGGAEAPEAAGAPKKTGFLPGIVITILKWVAVALGFIILGVTTTIITSKMISGKTVQQSPVGTREKYASGLPILSYAELGDLRGTTSDESPAVWSCNVKIGYEEEKKEVGDEIVQRKNQLRNAITIKLSRKKYEDLRADRMEEIQAELRTVVNGVLSAGKAQEVLLDSWTALR